MDTMNRLVPYSLIGAIIAILFVASTLWGCAPKPYVDYSSQIRDANGNPLYPTLSAEISKDDKSK